MHSDSTPSFTQVPDALIQWASQGRDHGNRKILVMTLFDLARPRGMSVIETTTAKLIDLTGVNAKQSMLDKLNDLESKGLIQQDRLKTGKKVVGTQIKLTLGGNQSTDEEPIEDLSNAQAREHSSLSSNSINPSTTSKSKKSNKSTDKEGYLKWLESYKKEFYNATGVTPGWRFSKRAEAYLRARIKEHGKELVIEVTKAVAKNPFWNGTSDKVESGIPGSPDTFLQPGHFLTEVQKIEGGEVKSKEGKAVGPSKPCPKCSGTMRVPKGSNEWVCQHNLNHTEDYEG